MSFYFLGALLVAIDCNAYFSIRFGITVYKGQVLTVDHLTPYFIFAFFGSIPNWPVLEVGIKAKVKGKENKGFSRVGHLGVDESEFLPTHFDCSALLYELSCLESNESDPYSST